MCLCKLLLSQNSHLCSLDLILSFSFVILNSLLFSTRIVFFLIIFIFWYVFCFLCNDFIIMSHICSKISIIFIIFISADRLDGAYNLPVSCRSLVDRCGSLGNCKPQILSLLKLILLSKYTLWTTWSSNFSSIII